MNTKDVKLLWGRSGNRCAFPDCKIVLSTSGDPSIIGEMAHIVAKNENGPRGKSDLDSDKRDEYNNLILLCPTHHTIIDKDPNEWTVQKLHEIKDSHEKWVTKQTSNNTILSYPISNSKFCNERVNQWTTFSNNLSWVAISLTPLTISEDIINPVSQTFVELIKEIELPKRFRLDRFDSIFNHYTKPNENGLINEYITDIENGIGYRIQIFRNGYIEFLFCLEWSCNSITKSHYEASTDEVPGITIFRYSDMFNIVKALIRNLLKIWRSELPFNNMLVTCMICNTKQSKLYSYEKKFSNNGVFGNLVNLPHIKYETVIYKEENDDEIVELVLKRIVHSFGLAIDKIYKEDGSINRPDHLYKFIK